MTVEGETHELEAPFIVLATANPIEYEGTYQLPEAQLDRFLMRISFGYLDRDGEWQILARRLERQRERTTLEAVTDAVGVLAMRAAIERIPVEDSVGRYIVDLTAATREHPEVLACLPPRGVVGDAVREGARRRQRSAARLAR